MGDPWDEQLPSWATALLMVLLILAGLALACHVHRLAGPVG